MFTDVCSILLNVAVLRTMSNKKYTTKTPVNSFQGEFEALCALVVGDVGDFAGFWGFWRWGRNQSLARSGFGGLAPPVDKNIFIVYKFKKINKIARISFIFFFFLMGS